MPHTLLTGASSGIGLHLAHVFAEHGHDLILTARRKKSLDALAKELRATHGVDVRVVPADLTDAKAPKALQDYIVKHDLVVEVLVNNAGFGGHGLFHERRLEDDLAMIQVNIAALTELTKRFLPAMVERSDGRILNVASTAGFLPGPLQAVYYATKAYVLSLSEALHEELRGTGVTVTALCPGPVKTEFIEVADVEHLDLFKFAAKPRPVAEYGYKAMQKGKPVAIHGALLKATLHGGLRLTPRAVARRLSRKSME